MTLPYAPNLTVDVYRGFDPSNPYPLTCATRALKGVRGYIRANMEAGRFGFGTQHLYWTHRMDFVLGTDIREAYNTQLDPAYSPAREDTILAADYPLKGWCTAFYVALVQVDRGGGFLRVYLDRVQPRPGGCLVNCAAANGCCCQLCTRNNLPLTLNWRWLNPPPAIAYTSGQMVWTPHNPIDGWYSPTYFQFYPTNVNFICPGDGVSAPYVQVNCGDQFYTFNLQAGYTCSPFSADFSIPACPGCTGNTSPQTIQLTQ